MSDPKKFKPYYIVEAFSKKTNQLRQLHLATEMGRMQKLASLETARARSKEFAKSLNESKILGVDDWKPMIHFQYTAKTKLLIS